MVEAESVQNKTTVYVVFILLIMSIGSIMPPLGYYLFGGPVDHLYRIPPIWPYTAGFAALWTIFYFCWGVGTAKVWLARESNPFAITALKIFFIQFVINVSWIPVVQASERPLTMSVIMDFICLIAVIPAGWAYWKVSPKCFYWLLPGMAWIPITTVIKVWRLFINYPL